MNRKFVSIIIRAAREAKVPLKTSKHSPPSNIEMLNVQRQRLITSLSQPLLRNCDKESITNKLHQNNNNITQLIESNKNNEVTKVINDIVEDLRSFFKYANSLRKAYSPIGPLKSGLTYESGPHQMAQILNEQYKSVFSTPTTDLHKIKLKQHLHPPMLSLDITEKLIIEAINSISSFSAAGPDGIPAQLYKDYASALSLPIKIIWEASLKTGTGRYCSRHCQTS